MKAMLQVGALYVVIAGLGYLLHKWDQRRMEDAWWRDRHQFDKWW